MKIDLSQFETLPEAVELAKAKERLGDFKMQRSAIEKEIDELNCNLSKPGQNKLAAEVDALLAGSKPPLVEEDETKRRDLGRVYHRLVVLDEAIKRQERTVAELRSKFSRQVCKELRPEAVKIVFKIAEAAKKLSEALDEERAFFENLQDNEISFTSWMPRAIFHGVGSLADGYSNVTLFLKRVGEDYQETKLALPNARPVTFVKSNGTIPRIKAA